MEKMRFAVVVALCVVCMSPLTAPAKEGAGKTTAAPKGAKDNAGKISAASQVIKEITSLPKRRIPPVLFHDAKAIAIFPKAEKADFMVSGRSAKGILLVRDSEGAWSSPVFITLSGGTLGWQVVAEPLDIILIFKVKKSVDDILAGKLVMNAKVAIAPGVVAPTMKSASDKQSKAEVTSYLRSKGKLVEDSTIAGTTVQIDAANNAAHYSAPKVEVSDILSGKVAKANEDVKALQKLLADYEKAK